MDRKFSLRRKNGQNVCEFVCEFSGWIRVDRLAEEFVKMCKKTGMTRKAIAGYCGITAATLWNYTSGKSPVPAAVWRSVEELQRL